MDTEPPSDVVALPPTPDRGHQLCYQDLLPEVVPYLDRSRHFRAGSGERDCAFGAEQESQQQLIRENINLAPLYLCDQSAVRIMVRAVTEGPTALGAWVQQQLEAGYLWACTAVDAVPGWKVFTPHPDFADFGAPTAVQRLFKKLCAGSDAVNDTELQDTVATYARVHSFVEDASYTRCRRLVTANRAFERLFLRRDERRAATLEELFGVSYVIQVGTSGPVVLLVDHVHQEKPEGLPFQDLYSTVVMPSDSPEVVRPLPRNGTIPLRFEDLPPDHEVLPTSLEVLPPDHEVLPADHEVLPKSRMVLPRFPDRPHRLPCKPPPPKSDSEREAEQKLNLQIFREKSKPLYLCDRSAVQIMVKAVREGPSPLGAWVQQQLDAGYLWACPSIDAIPGWKVFTPHPRADRGAPHIVNCLFQTHRHLVDSGAMNDPELYDTVQTYARVYGFVPDASHRAWRRLVTANRAFVDLFLGTEKRRSDTHWALYLAAGRSHPVVALLVDDVHQHKPEGPLF